MGILIGVHGLNNKPAPHELEKSWRKALLEGLTRDPRFDHDFSLIVHYWADLFYECPLERESEPYRQALQGMSAPTTEAPPKEALATLAVDELALRYPDLIRYFRVRSLRDEIRKRLLHLLRSQNSHALLVIAHSMGCVIAYDTLVGLSPSDCSVEMATFGCPLGFPQLWSRMQEEYGQLKVPSVVRSWTNFADPRDPVATTGFHRIFPANAAGVEIVDEMISNDYHSPSGESNPHKVYGYLRSSAFARKVARFLEQTRNQRG